MQSMCSMLTAWLVPTVSVKQLVHNYTRNIVTDVADLYIIAGYFHHVYVELV